MKRIIVMMLILSSLFLNSCFQTKLDCDSPQVKSLAKSCLIDIAVSGLLTGMVQEAGFLAVITPENVHDVLDEIKKCANNGNSKCIRIQNALQLEEAKKFFDPDEYVFTSVKCLEKNERYCKCKANVFINPLNEVAHVIYTAILTKDNKIKVTLTLLN